MPTRDERLRRARRPLTLLGLTVFTCTMALASLGCGSGNDGAAPPAPTTSTGSTVVAVASEAAAPDLQGVTIDVRRDPG